MQERIQTATPEEKKQVFEEIVPDHALHLMSDVFGNYVRRRCLSCLCLDMSADTSMPKGDTKTV